FVVEENYLEIHVAANRVDQVIAADRQPVAVAGNYPHLQVRPAGFQTCGESRRSAVNAVEAIGVHVVRESAGAADAGDEHHLLARNAERREGFLHLRQYRIVAAAWAPAHLLVAGQVLGGKSWKRRSGRHIHSERNRISSRMLGLAYTRPTLNNSMP